MNYAQLKNWNLDAVLNENAHQVSRKRGNSILGTVAKNSLANLARMGALSLTVFLLPPLLVRVLSKPVYATWVLILQIGTYVALFDGSIQSAISRFTGLSRGRNDDRYLGEILSSAGLVMAGAAVITAVLTLLGSWQLGILFSGIPPSIRVDAQRALFVFGISLAFSLPFSTLAGAFLGLQKNEVNAVAGSMGKILGAAGAAWAAYRHQSLVIMAIWMAGGNLLQSLLYLLAWLKLGPSRAIHWTHVTAAALSEFVTFCLALFATQLGGLLITGLDIPIVAAFDFHSAGYYAIAATVSMILSVPQGAVVNTLMPVAAAISATHDPKSLGQLLIRATRYSTALLCLITLPLLLGMRPFLQVWVGADYARHAFSMAMLLVIAQFIRLTLLPYAAFGFAAGQLEKMLISPLGEGVVNLAFSLGGAHYFGAVGVAFGTFVGAWAGVLLHFLNSMPRTDRLQFKRSELILSGILRPVLCCLPLYPLALFAMAMAPGRMIQAVLIACVELFAIVALWNLNFDGRERDQIAGLVLRFAHS
jgi:O-antigen/teichoic acid export membrane protein